MLCSINVIVSSICSLMSTDISAESLADSLVMRRSAANWVTQKVEAHAQVTQNHA